MKLFTVFLCLPLIGAVRSHLRDVDLHLPTETCDVIAEGGKICTPNACTLAKCALIPDAFCVADKCGCRARFHLFATEQDGYRDLTGPCSAFTQMEGAQLSFKKALMTQESAVEFLSTTPETQKKFFQGLDQFVFDIVSIMVDYIRTAVERNPNSANVKLHATAVTELRRLRTKMHRDGVRPSTGTTTIKPLVLPLIQQISLPFVENEWTTARTRPPMTTTSAPAVTRTTTAVTRTATNGAIVSTPQPAQSLPPPKPPIRFANETWYVFNRFNMDKMDDNNVFVDSHGRLHLRLIKRHSSWRCAGVKSVQPYGFGRYQFQIESRLDSLDPNTVFALFSQADNQPGIGIQFARWGDTDAKPVSFGVSRRRFPAPFAAGTTGHYAFNFVLTGTYTTHSYNWEKRNVSFSSQHDHQKNNKMLEFQKWAYVPRIASSIPHVPAPVTMYLCTYSDAAPTVQKDVEVIVHNFKFHPKPSAYIVHSGDTLSKIAARFGTSWQKIALDNKLVNPDAVFPGQVLVIL